VVNNNYIYKKYLYSNATYNSPVFFSCHQNE